MSDLVWMGNSKAGSRYALIVVVLHVAFVKRCSMFTPDEHQYLVKFMGTVCPQHLGGAIRCWDDVPERVMKLLDIVVVKPGV